MCRCATEFKYAFGNSANWQIPTTIHYSLLCILYYLLQRGESGRPLQAGAWGGAGGHWPPLRFERSRRCLRVAGGHWPPLRRVREGKGGLIARATDGCVRRGKWPADCRRCRWVRAGKGRQIAGATAGAGLRPGSFSLQRESLFLSLCRSLSIYLFLTLYLYLYLYLNLSLHTPGGNGNEGKKPCFSLLFGPAFEKRTAFFCGFAPGSTREAQGSCSNPGRNLQDI